MLIRLLEVDVYDDEEEEEEEGEEEVNVSAVNLSGCVVGKNATDNYIFGLFCLRLQNHPRPRLQSTPSGPTSKRFESFPLTRTPRTLRSGRSVLFTTKEC